MRANSFQKNLLFCISLIFCSIRLVSFAQIEGGFDRDRVRNYSQLSLRTQKKSAIQACFQQWFREKVRFFQRTLSDTVLGKSQPGLVNLGDFSNFFQQYFGAPVGKKTYRLLFTGVETAQIAEKGPRQIEFSQHQADEYIEGLSRVNTCWHEFQHILFIEAEKAGKKLSIKPDEWDPFRKPPIDEYADHIYIESLAEKTVEWLDVLLHEKTVLFQGAGMAFEKKVLDAAKYQKDLANSGLKRSYFLEHAVWAKAHDAWVRAWSLGKGIAPLSLGLKKEYQAITGIWIGSLEDIVRFYACGGMKDEEGVPIEVPHWVMKCGISRSPILVGPLNEKRLADANETRIVYEFRVLEQFRFKEKNSPFLGRGKITLSLVHPNPRIFLKATILAKKFLFESDLVAGNAALSLDLQDCPKDGVGKLELIFPTSGNASPSQPLLVKAEFRDSSPENLSKKRKCRFYSAETIFLINSGNETK